MNYYHPTTKRGSPSLTINLITFQPKKFTFNSIIMYFVLYLIQRLRDVHLTCNCSHIIHLWPIEYIYSEIKLYRVQRWALLSPGHCILHCLNSPNRGMCVQHFWKCLFCFSIHIVCWTSQQRCQFFTLIPCPSLFIQSFKNPNT